MEFQVGKIEYKKVYPGSFFMAFDRFLDALIETAEYESWNNYPVYMRPIIHNGKECWC